MYRSLTHLVRLVAVVIPLGMLLPVLASAEPPNQISRFEPAIKAIREAGTGPDTMLKSLLDSDSRFHFFNLETLVNVYKKRYPSLGKYYSMVKEMEDKLGDTSDIAKRIEFGKEMGLPPEAIAFLGKRAKESYEETKAWMGKNGWESGKDNPLNELMSTLQSITWAPYEEDRELVRKQMVSEIDEIAESDYDLHKLQEGIHEMRRDLRRILTLVQSLRNVVFDEATSLPDPDRYLKDSRVQKKYSTLDLSPFEKEPISLPRDALYGLASLVKRFGDIKDIGEAEQSWVPEALLGAKLVKDEAEARLRATEYVKKHPKYKELYAEAKNLAAELRESNVLKVFRSRCEYHRLAL